MTTSVSTPPLAVDATQLLELALRLCASHNGRAVSLQHLALAELINAYRALPADAVLVLPVAAPADEIRRDTDGGAYVLRAVDGAIAMTTLDSLGDDTTQAYSPAQIRQLVRDMSSVLAALEGRR